MSEVLLINRADIMRLTGLNGNIDSDKILPAVKSAQDIHLQPVIGTKLLDAIKALIAAGTLDDAGNEAYATITYTYITPFLVFKTMWDLLPFLQYSIANGGIFQHNAENSATPSREEVDILITRFKDKADFYGGRLVDYMCDNTESFTELSESISGGELNDGKNEPFSGIVI